MGGSGPVGRDVRRGRSLFDGNAVSHLMCIQCTFENLVLFLYYRRDVYVAFHRRI